MEGIEKEKESKYKSRLPSAKYKGFAYKISSVSSIPSRRNKVPVEEVKEKPKSNFRPEIKDKRLSKPVQ